MVLLSHSEMSNAGKPLACGSPAESHPRRRWVLIALAIVCLVVGFWVLPSRRWVIDAYHWIRQLDRREGFCVFVAIYTLLSAVGLPTSPLNVGAGLLFGLLLGFL